MRKVLIPLPLIALLLLPARLEAAWVSTACEGTSQGDDAVLTMSCVPANGNTVFILASLVDETHTISITGSSYSNWAAVVGPIDSAGFTIRAYIFCATADGVDNTFTVTTSGTAGAHGHAKAFSGGTCTVNGGGSANDDTSSPYELTTDLIATSTDLLLAVIRSDSGADFAPGTDFTQFGTDALASAAEYRILTSSVTYDTPFTAGTAENALLVGVAMTAAASSTARNCLLLGACE